MNFLLSIAFVICWSSGFIGAKLGGGTASAVTILMRRSLPLAVILISRVVDVLAQRLEPVLAACRYRQGLLRGRRCDP